MKYIIHTYNKEEYIVRWQNSALLHVCFEGKINIQKIQQFTMYFLCVYLVFFNYEDLPNITYTSEE